MEDGNLICGIQNDNSMIVLEIAAGISTEEKAFVEPAAATLPIHVDDGNQDQDSFLRSYSADQEVSGDDCGLSTSGKLSASNTSSYCRIAGLSTENSSNAILFNHKNAGEQVLSDSSGKWFIFWVVL